MWAPVAPCGPHCLAEPPGLRAGGLRRALRVAGLLAVLLAGTALRLVPRRWRGWALRGCARGALRVLGVRLQVTGRLPDHRALVVANHVSWLDPVLLPALGLPRLVAKAEVRAWPVVGRLAVDAGAVFLDRTRPRTLPPAVAQVRGALAGGAVVAVFPEGTTSCGEGAGGFRPAFFQAAIEASAPVVPVSLRFEWAGAPSTWPAFIGTETLWTSLGRVLSMRGLVIRVAIGTAIHAGPGATRRALARVAEAEVHGCASRSAPSVPRHIAMYRVSLGACRPGRSPSHGSLTSPTR